eukprot:365154-Chlamydomonas_euryale.AAC.3
MVGAWSCCSACAGPRGATSAPPHVPSCRRQPDKLHAIRRGSPGRVVGACYGPVKGCDGRWKRKSIKSAGRSIHTYVGRPLSHTATARARGCRSHPS